MWWDALVVLWGGLIVWALFKVAGTLVVIQNLLMPEDE
jgi:hypothetical protein